MVERINTNRVWRREKGYKSQIQEQERICHKQSLLSLYKDMKRGSVNYRTKA